MTTNNNCSVPVFINVNINFSSSACFCGTVDPTQVYGPEGWGFADHHRRARSRRVCFITMQSEPAAYNDQLGGIRFIIIYNICNRFSTNRFLCECTTQPINKARQYHELLFFNTTINRLCQSRQTENESLPYPVSRVCHYTFWCFVTDGCF